MTFNYGSGSLPRYSAFVDVEGELRAETAAAYLIYDGSRSVWVPKHLVKYDPDEGVFTMPERLAYEKGLI